MEKYTFLKCEQPRFNIFRRKFCHFDLYENNSLFFFPQKRDAYFIKGPIK